MRKVLTAVVLLTSLAAPADAATLLKLTFTGTVTSFDNAAMTPFPQVKIGDAWTAVYVFDTTKGFFDNSGPSGSNGGTLYGVPSPSVEANLTLDGTTFAAQGGYQDFSQARNIPGQAFITADVSSNNGLTYFQNTIWSTALPNIFESLKYTCQPSDFSCTGILNLPNGKINAKLTDVTEVFGAVPEPATWALFIIGFGAIGGLLRTQRQKTAVVTGAT